MSQLTEKIELYKNQIEELGLGIDEGLISAVAKSLGPSIYNEDSSRVSCSDGDEKARVKNNYLIGKLGLTDGPALDEAIEAVCAEMGSSNRNKYRAVFYALLASKLGKADVYS